MKNASHNRTPSTAVITMAEAALRYIHPLVYAGTDKESLRQLRRLARSSSKDLLLEAQSIAKEFQPSPAERVTMERVGHAISRMLHAANLEKSPKARLRKIDAMTLILDDDTHLGASLTQIASRHGGSKQSLSLSKKRLLNSCCYHNSPAY